MTETAGIDGNDGAWRVLVVDDHAVTRSGIRLLVEVSGGEVVGEASTGHEAVRLCRELRPDLILMDLEMPEMDGIEAIRVLRAEFPELSVLVLTVHENEDAVFEAIRAGAAGYLPKSAGAEDVREALAALRAGDTYMSPAVAGLAIRSLSRRIDEARNQTKAPEVATPREREVLDHLAEGLSARAISTRLGISERTVNTHIGHLYRKLNVNNRVDAIVAGMRLGLLETPR